MAEHRSAREALAPASAAEALDLSSGTCDHARMTEQEIKIHDATLQLEAALNLAGLRYEKRSEHTYVDFEKRGYARFAVCDNPKVLLSKHGTRPVIVALELHPAGAKVSRRKITVDAKGYPANVIKAIRKVAGGVQ